MSFKEAESKHIRIQSWKENVMNSMKRTAQGMGGSQWLMIILMLLFLLTYHIIFRPLFFLEVLKDNVKGNIKSTTGRDIVEDLAMYAGTALVFLCVYFIGVKYPDPIIFDWNNNPETYVADDETDSSQMIPIISSLPDDKLETKEIDQELSETYKAMHDINPDFDAWITIDGTDIDYPVMYTPDDPERYLHKDFYGAESFDGLPFIDARCREITDCSDNTILYAHNMKDGSMFGNLTDFDNAEYCREHPTIRLDTAAGEIVYDIMSVFYDRVYYADEDVFKFYNFIDASDEKSFDDAVNQYLGKSIYDTGVTAKYGDKLITLVTCTYQTENGRFVVVARNTQENL